MTLKELLKAESVKSVGKPLSLDAVKVLMNVSGDEWMNALIELTLSGACILSSVTGSDGNSVSMIQYVPSSVSEATVSTEPVEAGVKAVKRGRPKVSPDMKRVILNHVRLPLWLSEHLKDRGDSGKVVEKALIHFYGLVPPG